MSKSDEGLLLTIARGMSGYFVALVTENGDVLATGLGRYDNPEQAKEEAREWAYQEPALTLDPSIMSDVLKAVPISKIKNKDEFGDEDNIKCVEGVITKFFPVKKGDDYEYQNGIFKSGDAEIDICFSKCTQPDSVKGKKIRIESQKTDGHGWQGIKINDQEFEKGGETKQKRVLKITPTAKISFPGGGEPASTGSAQNGKPGNSAQQQQSQSVLVHPMEWLENAMLAHAKIHDLVNETYGTDPESLIFRSSSTHTIFIEAAKSGQLHNFAERMAKKRASTKWKTDPTQWREFVFPSGKCEGKTLTEIDEEKLMEYYDFYKAKEEQGEAPGPINKCVFVAAEELGYLKNRQEREEAERAQQASDQQLDPVVEDDIPF